MEEAETKKQEKAMEKEHGRHGLKKIKTGTKKTEIWSEIQKLKTDTQRDT